MPKDVIELLEAARTELDCERLDGARLALSDYWANRRPENGTVESDLQAFEITRDIIAHTPSDKSRSVRTLKRPRRILMTLPENPLSGEPCTFQLRRRTMAKGFRLPTAARYTMSRQILTSKGAYCMPGNPTER